VIREIPGITDCFAGDEGDGGVVTVSLVVPRVCRALTQALADDERVELPRALELRRA
jgi:hypothetical protein